MEMLEPDTEVVVFLDGDFSDHPEEMPMLTRPILEGRADLVIGSRTLGRKEPGALLPVAVFGNWLSTRLVKWGWGAPVHRFGSLPRHTLRFPAAAGHARPRFRLDGGDAGEGLGPRAQGDGGAGNLPETGGEIEGLRDREGEHPGGRENPLHHREGVDGWNTAEPIMISF
jgi:hypothetical protein